MASVSSKTKISDSPQKDGRRFVRYSFICNGNDSTQISIVLGPMLVPAAFDTDAHMIDLESKVLNKLARDEENQIIEIGAVPDPLGYSLNPRWSTTKNIAKAVFRWMMRERDPRIVIYLEPLINYIKTNYNTAQIGNLLDMTTPQVQKLNRRITTVLDPSADSLKDLLASFDLDQEDIS